MSVHEAVTLALQAAAFSDGGEIFMLNVGEPVNVLELAERMIRLSGRVVGEEIAIEFVGARPGEKLTEQLQDIDEEAHPTDHPAITRLTPIAVDAERLERTIDELGAWPRAAMTTTCASCSPSSRAVDPADPVPPGSPLISSESPV